MISLRWSSFAQARRTAGQAPPVFEPVQQVDVPLQIGNIIADIGHAAIFAAYLLPFLQVFRIKIFDALELEFSTNSVSCGPALVLKYMAG